jgi:hypothetical protein
MSIPRTLLIGVVAAVAIAIPANAFALDHVTITTSPVSLPVAAKKKLPLCKKHQKSTKKHPCRKRKRTVAGVAVRENPRVRGWTARVFIDELDDSSWQTELVIQRKVGNATESHTWSRMLPPGSVNISDDLAGATWTNPWAVAPQPQPFWDSGSNFRATGALSPGTPPSGCSGGTFQTRTGVLELKGILEPLDDYFHRLTVHAFPATLTANTGAPFTCGSPPLTCFHGTTVFVGDTRAFENGFFLASLSNGAALEEYIKQRSAAPFDIFDALTVSGLPATDISFASGFGTGTISTDGAAPWFTGSFNFALAGNPLQFPNPACGGAQSTFGQGTSSGGIVPHFAASAPGSLWGSPFSGGPTIFTQSP